MTPKTRILFFLLVGVCIMLFGLFIFSIFRQPPTPSDESTLTATPTTDARPITQEEQKYPEAQPQVFATEPGVTTKGTLVLTSDPSDVRVRIELGQSEAPESAIPIPRNITPFKVSGIPVGTHHIFAAKPGYEIYETVVTIRPDTTTRLHIALVPMQ